MRNLGRLLARGVKIWADFWPEVLPEKCRVVLFISKNCGL
jgi:hypothetical protein